MNKTCFLFALICSLLFGSVIAGVAKIEDTEKELALADEEAIDQLELSPDEKIGVPEIEHSGGYGAYGYGRGRGYGYKHKRGRGYGHGHGYYKHGYYKHGYYKHGRGRGRGYGYGKGRGYRHW